MNAPQLSASATEGKPASKPAQRSWRFMPGGLSIRHRLPLLIAVLLFSVIAASTWASYRGVKDSALGVGRERLLNLTQQLASLLQQSSATLMNKTLAVANDPAVKAFVRSPSATTRSQAAAVLQPFLAPQDPNSLQVEIRNTAGSPLLVLPDGASPEPANLELEFKQSSVDPFKAAGAIRVSKEMPSYPSVAAVKDDAGNPIAYLVRWRKLSSTPEARKQLTDLLGSQSALYLGNSQGDVWTDLVSVVPKPPVSLSSTRETVHYVRDGKSVMALGRPISGTPWFVMVEFPDQIFLTQANRFLQRMAVIGLILFGLGMVGAFVLSRSITQPLHLLTEAAGAIRSGDYSRRVEFSRRDELGKLASAFNTMSARVNESQAELEKKITERTSQLENANKELESFSYSVSHDLRAPLRAINGFSQILSEDYAKRVPEEAQRYLNMIQDNAKKMGQLVDDLLNFSRLGRQALQKQRVSPAEMARQILEELHSENQSRHVEVSIGDLPEVQADPSLLRQVYVNLISNALKYTRARTDARIEIGAVNANGDGTVFYVQDNGAGFDMKYAGKLFGVFQRLHRAEEFEGTGVGLAIVHRIIQRHGGRIWAEAEVDKGAKFSFTL